MFEPKDKINFTFDNRTRQGTIMGLASEATDADPVYFVKADHLVETVAFTILKLKASEMTRA